LAAGAAAADAFGLVSAPTTAAAAARFETREGARVSVTVDDVQCPPACSALRGSHTDSDFN